MSDRSPNCGLCGAVCRAPGGDQDELRAQCAAMRDFVVKIRKDTAMQFAAPLVQGLPPTSQPLMNWKLREFAAHRRDFDPKALRMEDDPPGVVPEIPRIPDLVRKPRRGLPR